MHNICYIRFSASAHRPIFIDCLFIFIRIISALARQRPTEYYYYKSINNIAFLLPNHAPQCSYHDRQYRMPFQVRSNEWKKRKIVQQRKARRIAVAWRPRAPTGQPKDGAEYPSSESTRRGRRSARIRRSCTCNFYGFPADEPRPYCLLSAFVGLPLPSSWARTALSYSGQTFLEHDCIPMHAVCMPGCAMRYWLAKSQANTMHTRDTEKKTNNSKKRNYKK